MVGRVAEAERLALAAHELGDPAHARHAHTNKAAPRLSQRRREDRLAEYVATVETFVSRHPALVAWRAVLPLAHMLRGEREEGLAAFEDLARDDFAAISRDMFWFTAVCIVSEACALIGDAERAEVLYAMLAPYSERMVQVTQAACFGSAHRFLGLLAMTAGRTDDAAAHFEAALARNLDRGVLPVVPFIRTEYAQMLLARRGPGDIARAHELVTAALAQAEAANIAMLVARLRPMLEACESLTTHP
jgi:hypothetical protein